MIDYTIGDYIVAIKDHTQGKFKKGDVFTCKGLKHSNCICNIIIVDVGLISNSDRSLCHICKTINIENYLHFFSSSCFKKLDYDISELTEILENENQNIKS